MSALEERHTQIWPPNRRYIIALIIASAFGLSTFFLDDVEGWLGFLIVLLLPGMFVSMALCGNMHAFPLWLAALANTLFYFGLTLMVWKIIHLFRRNKG